MLLYDILELNLSISKTRVNFLSKWYKQFQLVKLIVVSSVWGFKSTFRCEQRSLHEKFPRHSGF